MKDLDKVFQFIRAIDSPLRRKIIAVMEGGQAMTQRQIMTQTGLIQPVASKNLTILVRSGALRFDKIGTSKLYTITKTCNRTLKSLRSLKDVI